MKSSRQSCSYYLLDPGMRWDNHFRITNFIVIFHLFVYSLKIKGIPFLALIVAARICRRL